MRLKSYSAPTMAEAMEMVRAELGDDAIIVSTQRASGGGMGVRVSAALEESDLDDDIAEALTGHSASSSLEALRQGLSDHGTPAPLIEQIISAARHVRAEEPLRLCAGAFEKGFTFAPLPTSKSTRPFILIGPPGSGKTVTVAKLAARAILSQHTVGVVQADAVRAGSLEQLQAFARILDIEVVRARGPEGLGKVLTKLEGPPDLVFIDSPGLNPFNEHDMNYLRRMIKAGDVEPILVMAAGGDPYEAAEMARIFAEVGATRLLATRLDMTRRLGSILAAAAAADLAFCNVTIAPHVANGLCPLNPMSLAHLILEPEASPEDSLATNYDFTDDENLKAEALS